MNKEVCMESKCIAEVPMKQMKQSVEQNRAAYERLVAEKKELDERIMKLAKILQDQRKMESIHCRQRDVMARQLELMVQYSSLLNERILVWVHPIDN